MIKRMRYSVRYRVMMVIITGIVGLWLFCFLAVNYSISVVRDQALDVSRSFLNKDIEKFDEQLGLVRQNILALISSDARLFRLSNITEQPDFTIEYGQAVRVLSDEFIMQSDIANVFLFVEGTNRFTIITPSKTMEHHNIYSGIKDYFVLPKEGRDVDNLISAGNWKILDIADSKILMCSYHNNAVHLGAWVSLSDFLSMYGEDTLINVYKNGQCICSNINPDINLDLNSASKDHYIISALLPECGLEFIQFLPKRKILQNLPLLRFMLIIISFIFTAGLVLFYTELKHDIFKPIANLSESARAVSDGNLAYRANLPSKRNEFYDLSVLFNSMLDSLQQHENRTLQFEKEKQKSKILQLELQVKPHFYLNVLNNIYALARSGRNDKIKILSISMIRYFRYLFDYPSDQSTLASEIQHAQNYFDIQSIRYPGELTLELEIEEGLDAKPIPFLSIQPLLDNAVKHAHTSGEAMTLKIRAYTDMAPCGRQIYIHVIDNGSRFPNEIMDAINNTSFFNGTDNGHIGLRNLYHRLQLMYEGNFQLKVTINDNNTDVWFSIPA